MVIIWVAQMVKVIVAIVFMVMVATTGCSNKVVSMVNNDRIINKCVKLTIGINFIMK
jgi:hypothetical protein